MIERFVICCIARHDIFARVEQVCSEQGLRALLLTEPKLPTLRHVTALIHDLECPGSPAVLDIVHGFRRLYPSRPILIYCRPTTVAAGLVARLSDVPGTANWNQRPDSTEERLLLGRVLRSLVSRVPELAIRTLFNFMRPGAARPVAMFLDALLDRLEDGGDGAPQVAEIAWRSGFKPWIVRRACHVESLPPPDRLIRWVTLIHTIARAELEKVSVARAAGKTGLTDKHIRNLRSSLVPELSRLTGTGAHDALALTVMRFAEVCGLAHEHVNAATRILA